MDNMKEIIFWAVWVICGIIMLLFYAKRKYTIKSVFLGMATGITALLILHFFGDYVGYSPNLNLFNTATALILGVPGVIMIYAVNRFL